MYAARLRKPRCGGKTTRSLANLAIEGMAMEPDDDALFDRLRDEAVPPPLATQVILKLYDHPDADPGLAITPLERAG